VTTPLPIPQRIIRAVTSRLGGDRDGVEHEGEEGPQRHRELVRGEVDGGVGRSHGDGVGRDEQCGAQGQRPHDQGYAGAPGRSDPGGVRAQRGALAARTADHDHHERNGAGHLGEDRAEGRPGEPETLERAGAVHEQDVEGDVEQVAADGDVERGAGVLQAAQDAGRGQHQQQRRRPEQRDPQVRRRVVGDGRVGAEGGDERVGEDEADEGRDHADDHGQPEAVDALGEGTADVARPQPSRDAGRGAVGEEDADPDDGLQHDRGDAEAGELRGAEVADDGGVGEQEERLGDQRQEGRDGEPEDLPVLGPTRSRGHAALHEVRA
jgi:hypothetical protein